MKKKTRVISFILLSIFLVTNMGMPVRAEEIDDSNTDSSEETVYDVNLPEENADEEEDFSIGEGLTDIQEEGDDSDVLNYLAEDNDAPTKLRINLLSTPHGVEKSALSFSWSNSMENGMESQKAYRIRIFLRTENLTQGTFVYDSEWVDSSDNTSVLYDLSQELADNELYYWQVQTMNEDGKESSFSEPQAFSTAVGSEWAGRNGIWGSDGQKTVFLRRKLQRPDNLERAVLSVTATSADETKQYVYNLYVNGEEIGLGPVRTNGKTAYYHTYDITDLLTEEENIIGSICYSEKKASFLSQITFFYSDGTKEIIDNTARDTGAWKVKNADNVFVGNNNSSIGTNYYTARQDNLNVSQYPFDWCTAGYADGGWSVPVVKDYLSNYELKPSGLAGMKRYPVTPQSVEKQADGSWLVDFGSEIVGGIELNISSGGGAITLEYGEELDESGNAKYKLSTGNVYQETWTLRSGWQKVSGIGMKTFRYVTVRNCADNIGTDNIMGLTIRQEFEDEASSFSSSNNLLNELYNMMKYTSKITAQDLYVDTQNRERNPYEGDALITAMNSYSFSEASPSAKFTAEYLLDNTTWPAEYSLYNIMLIYENYMYTGDMRNLEQSYQKLKEKSLEEYFDSSVGLMGDITSPRVSNQKIMVDWPSTETDGYNKEESYYNTVFNAVCAGGYADMASIAEALGHTEESEYYKGLSDTIRQNMIKKLYNSETGEYYDGLDVNGKQVKHSSQHATAYALAFGIYESQSMADRMAGVIEQDQEVKMSVYGTYFLLQGLYQSNHGDLARKIMSNPDDILGVKSWAYMMYGLGATVTSEAWNSDLKSNISLCHPWGTAPGSMLSRGLFGIRPTEAGFDSFQIKLQPGGVSQASIKQPTLKGTIEISYTMDGKGGISCDVTVPSNSKADIYIPVSKNNAVLTVDGKRVSASREDGYLVYTLSAGSHTVTADAGIYEDASELAMTDVVYDVYFGQKWNGEATNGVRVGKTSGEKVEAVTFRLMNQQNAGNVEYSAYMQSYGWQDWVSEGAAGKPGEGKRLEAVRLRLTGELAQQIDVYYRVYVEGYGWLDWAENGEPAGTSGYAKEVRSLQAKIVKKNDEAPGTTECPYKSTRKQIEYRTHVQSYGWQEKCGDGEVSGTVGSAKRLEAIKINLDDTEYSGGVTYCTHVQSYGWQNWKQDGEESGTSGQSKRLEAIKIKLTGQIEEYYDVYYRVHVQSYGWLDWAKNGEPAGTEGYAKRLEAIQIKLVKKGNQAPGSTENCFRKAGIAYRTHVQSYGWQSCVFDGDLYGTEGEAKRLEAISIVNKDAQTSGDVEYRTHVQTYGWETSWKRNGEVSGTEGEAKRLEAIQIRLTDELKQKYDVYYRVHVQSYGWLDWAKNGEPAGTEGLAKRLEAIEIRYVAKGEAAPGKTATPYIDGRNESKAE
ncbi:MAG: family 78 glycoside hydrolase catalytic domain [Lachnoclostridium sp.]|nr:family 78 glycoside hydrolase catalytic domain [Lachnoclostridium sp.]